MMFTRITPVALLLALVAMMAVSTPVTADSGLRLLSQTNPTSGTGVIDAEDRKRILATTEIDHAHRELKSSDSKRRGGSSDSKRRGGSSGKSAGKSDSSSGKKFKKTDKSGKWDKHQKAGEKPKSIKRKKTSKKKNKRCNKKTKSVKSKIQKSKKKRSRNKKSKKPKTKKQADATRIPGQCVADHVCAEIRGDPHITTFDGLKYDCQGAGEFVLLKSLDSPLEVQARFHEGRVAGEGKKAISITQGISIDEGVEGSPQFDVFTKEENGECSMSIYINGELATDFGADGLKYPGIEFMPDVDVGADFLDYVFFTGSALMFTTSVKMGSFGCVLNSKICLPPNIATGEKIVGLLGSPFGPDWMDETGKALDSTNSDWLPAYNYCTKTWCTTAEESIFGYEPGTNHAMFDKCSAPYNPTAENLVENPSTACEECCAPAPTVGSYNECLVECVEGDVVDCEADLFAEVVLANAERQCPEPIPEKPECTVNGDCNGGKECVRGYCLTPPPVTPPVDETPPDDRSGPEDDTSPDDKSTDKAFTKGDPHFKTFGGELYDFHGECDLILLDNPEFKEGMGMQIQIRTKITDWWSSVEAAAVKIGEETLEIQANLDSTEWMWINGQANDVLEDGKWYHARLSGFLVRFKQTMTRAGEMREANIYFEGSDKAGAKDPLVLKTFKSFVHLDVNWKGSDNYNGATGLLGSQAHAGARLGRSGELIEDVNAFGQDWQVSETDAQLFHSYEGVVVAPNKCRMPEETLAKQEMRNRRLAEGMSYEQAEAACDHASAEEKDACIYDVLATQDVDMAGAW